MENALMVWPEGKENLSGGSTFDQQCGSIWQGRARWLKCFSALNTKIPKTAAAPAALTAANRCGPPKPRSKKPSAYQIQPSPKRVTVMVQTRTQRGARHRFIRCITR